MRTVFILAAMCSVHCGMAANIIIARMRGATLVQAFSPETTPQPTPNQSFIERIRANFGNFCCYKKPDVATPDNRSSESNTAYPSTHTLRSNIPT